MPSVEKDKLFLSVPVVCRTYTAQRELNTVTYANYKQLRAQYASALGSEQEQGEESLLVFPDEPCRMAAGLDIRLASAPAYLVCCYDSYQLTNYVSAAMYVQFSLGLQQTQSFALADMGALAPLLALNWAQTTREDLLLVCMEQVYDRAESWEASRYPRADALAMVSVSRRQGAYQLIACTWREAALHPWRPMAEQQLAAASCRLIDDQLASLSLGQDEVTIIPHSYSAGYCQHVSKCYPHIYQRRDGRNLGTADCFYSLEELSQLGQQRPYLLFVLADRRGSVGVLLVRSVTSISRREGEAV